MNHPRIRSILSLVAAASLTASLAADPPKPETPKPESPKAPTPPAPPTPAPPAPKPESPKPESPKPDAPKPEAPKDEMKPSVEYWPNSKQPKYKYEMRKDPADGKWKRNGYSQAFYENGVMEREGYYRNNERYGLWKYYDGAGKLLRTEDRGEPKPSAPKPTTPTAPKPTTPPATPPATPPSTPPSTPPATPPAGPK